MKKASCGIVVALAVAGAGCGGAPSAEDFAGLYRGTGTTVYANSRGANFEEESNGWSESLSASASDDNEKILFAGSCRLTATVRDDLHFDLNPIDCDLGQGPECHVTDRIRSGVGTLSEDRLTLLMTVKGEWVQTQCVDSAMNQTFTYTSTVKLKRQ